MKKILILVHFLCFINLFCKASNTENASWVWAKGFTSSNSGGDYGTSLILHPNGNIYCLGYFQAYQGVNNISTGTSLSIGGVSQGNAFVAVFDQAGNLINIEPARGITSNDNVNFDGRPTVDDSGYLYLAVILTGSAIVDTIQIGNVLGNGYLSKWTPDGRCLWVKLETGGTYSSTISDPIFYDGSIYIGGGYNGNAMSLGNCNLSNPTGIIPSFNGKLDKTGNCVWVKQAAGAKTGGTASMRLCAVQGGYTYLCCRTDSCFFYDTIQNCGENTKIKGCVMQTDTNGAVQWIRMFTADDAHSSSGKVAIDTSGNSYLTGIFDTTFYIGNDTLMKTQQHPYISYLAKYDKRGIFLWIKTMPCTRLGGILGIYTDAVGYTYLTGYYSGTATFGNTTITAQSSNDLFVTRYDPDGNCMGVVTVPNAEGFDITEDSAGNAFVTGATVANTTIGNTALIGNNFFLAKLSAINYPTGQQSILRETTLQIYSNPNRGQFIITVPQSITQAASGFLSIYDNTGNEILHQTVDLSSSTLTINLGNVNRGLYNVQLAANGNTFTGRVVIQ